MKNWKKIPNQAIIEKTAEALKANGIEVFITENGEEAKKKVLEIIPQGSEVMTMSSVTLETIGLNEEINKSDKYNSIRNKLSSMSRETQSREMSILGSSPEWAVGSVHAVTTDGKIMIASNGGSQLPAYVYGSDHVIWVIGAQKIVKNLDLGWERLNEHTLPLESERVKKAYGMPHSNISKVLIINKEVRPGRITAIIVKEVLGF